jgi:hypothetical protein
MQAKSDSKEQQGINPSPGQTSNPKEMRAATLAQPAHGPRRIHQQEVTLFFLFLTAIFGIGVRIFPLLRNNFPLVDGGMFYNMILDLQANHYRLPAYTTYNLLQIPYGYPPLAFYFTGLINSLTHLPLLELIRWMPFVGNLLVLPVVYVFARQLLRSSPSAALVTFIYAMMPNTYWWQITGGGLTRSLGAFFGFLTVYCALRMFQEKRTAWLLGTLAAGTLVILSHPEWALQAAVGAALMGLFWGRNRTGLLHALLVLLGTIILTSPWWLTVMLQHGAGTFLNASQSTDSRLLFLTPLLTLSFTSENVAFLSVFAVIGIFLALARHEYFLPVWVLAGLFVDPRGGVPFTLLPFSILAAGVVTDLAAPYFLRLRGREGDEWWQALELPLGKAFIGFLIIFCLANAYTVSNTISFHALTTQERLALTWAATETDSRDNFLVLSGETNPLHSALLEWFPALTGRHNLTTVQGSEWLSGKQHYQVRLKLFSQAQNCLYAGTDCLSGLVKAYGEPIDFIVLSQEDGIIPVESTPLYQSLRDSSEFKMVYMNEEVYIFERRP